MSVSELVDQAADRVESEFSPHPSVLAELSGTLGSIYFSIGNYERAQEYLERTVFLLEGEPEGPTRDQRLAVALKRLSDTVWGTDVDSGAVLASRAYRLATGIKPPTFDAAKAVVETAHLALPEHRDSARSARLGVSNKDVGHPEFDETLEGCTSSDPGMAPGKIVVA
jgi:hypothetical protein